MSAIDGAGASALGDEVPRVVTTGRKILQGIDEETGEHAELRPAGKGYKVVRHPAADDSASPRAAFVDALSFTVIPPEDQGQQGVLWVLNQMRRFVPIGEGAAGFKGRPTGGAGFKASAEVGIWREGAFDSIGLARWGGDSQRGRVLFSMMGKGCALVNDWAALASWLQEHRARITRADVAHDDHEGRVASIEWAIEQYRAGGFNAGGRRPAHSVFGDWLDGAAAAAGRTLTIGNRASGKHCRIYEKGKQLGEPSSRWTRIEVEWRNQDRVIPFDVLTRPGQYLAGAYPCLRALDAEQCRLRTVAKGGSISFDKAMENAKQQTGKLVHLALRVYGGDCGEVVLRLVREGMPGRIAPYSYQLADDPAVLDASTPGGWAEHAADMPRRRRGVSDVGSSVPANDLPSC
jgi:phage replication initiation protein